MLPDNTNLPAWLETVLAPWQERLDIIRHKLKFVDNRPRVACLEQIDPPVACGASLDAMVELAGGAPVPVAGDRLLFPPDIVIMVRPGRSIGESLREMEALPRSDWFRESPASADSRVFVLDGQHYFNHPDQAGPAGIEDVELLAEVIGSADFYFGFEGSGWIRFNV